MKIRILVAILIAILYHYVSIRSLDAATLYVDPDDVSVDIQAPYIYPGIQVAVDAADPGDTVVVPNGSYSENVIIDKPLTLKSLNGPNETTVIAKNPRDHVFTINAENVKLSGFTIYGAGNSKAGIYLSSMAAHCIVKENRCGISSDKKNHYGIVLEQSDHNTILDNLCWFSSGSGIRVIESSGNMFRGNDSSHNLSGFVVKDSDRNLFEENECLWNEQVGIYLICADFNILRENYSLGGYYGIRVNCNSNGDIITGNQVMSNKCYTSSQNGITILYGNDNHLIYNTIWNSGSYGMKIEYSQDNNIWLNTHLNNGLLPVASFYSSNRWNGPTPIWYTFNAKTFIGFLGNYWDNHNSIDSDGNGVTDMSYELYNDEPDDDYPLVKKPYENSWDWNVLCSGAETISAGNDRTVLSALTISPGMVTIEGGSLTIGGLW